MGFSVLAGKSAQSMGGAHRLSDRTDGIPESCDTKNAVLGQCQIISFTHNRWGPRAPSVLMSEKRPALPVLML